MSLTCLWFSRTCTCFSIDFLHLIDCLGRSLCQHAACCFVVIFLVCSGTQSCWHISFRLFVFKRKTLLCFLRSVFFLFIFPFTFLYPGGNTLYPLVLTVFYCRAECPKVCASTTVSLTENAENICLKYDSFIFFFNYSPWSLQLGSTIYIFLEFLFGFCPVPAGVVQQGTVCEASSQLFTPCSCPAMRNHLFFHKLHNTLRRWITINGFMQVNDGMGTIWYLFGMAQTGNICREMST